jgi:ABC-2 type transport system ATP-binding protein
MNHVIEVNGVSKSFRKKIALDNVTLRVPEGVVFALLGENGAGKTTLIRCLLGLDKPDSGTISVVDMNPRKKGTEIRRQVGYVSDTPALYEWMSVHEIGWFASGFYEPRYYLEYAKLITEFGLDLEEKIKHLSKGGRAKVALALSMAHQPNLLILDEPTSGLDTIVRRHFLESMIEVAAKGRTILLSSHQINEVERVADWVAIVNQGKVVACDTLENLKSRFERWVVTFETSQIPFSPQGATIVHHEGKGQRRQQFVVRDCVPDTLWKIREQVGVVDVEVHPPTLEEVFVALMKAEPSEQDAQSNQPTEGIDVISSSNLNPGESA